MARLVIPCALMLLPAAGLAAYYPPTPPPATETVVKFAVTPMAEPKPALKYPLLPERREMTPGNPLYGYLKCFMEQNHFYFHKDSIEKREKYQTMPLAELPVKDLKGYGGSSLRQADWAARLDTPDWQILLPAKRDGIRLLLPDLQQMRMLAAALRVRFRVENAEKDFAAGNRSAKTMFALSRHLGEHPTLIGGLVGVAVGMISVGCVEEMVGQPGCPNYYWALTQLPEPFIDLRKGMEGETMWLEADLGPIDDKEPMTDAEIKKAVARLTALFRELQESRTADLDAWLDKRAGDAAHVEAARKRLVDAEFAEATVKRLPAKQVVLLDEKLHYETERDHLAKWLTLPLWEIESRKIGLEPRGRDDRLLTGLIASYVKVRQSQARLQQRLAMLRHVEAIRLHAAETGKLPAGLQDVKVPLPVDPVTGRPFKYTLDDGKAVLKGTPPAGQEAHAGANVKYEITLRK